MGFQDRDYYREGWAKKQGHVEKSPLRMNLGQAANSAPPVNVSPPPPPPPYCAKRLLKKRPRSWHPVLTLLATFFVCLLVWLLLHLVVRFQA
jgi:hypothetical protein